MKTLLAAMLLVMAGQTAIIYSQGRKIKFEKSEQRAILEAMKFHGDMHREEIGRLRAVNRKLHEENASLKAVHSLRKNVYTPNTIHIPSGPLQFFTRDL